jgi:hypothetical protein
MDRERKRREAAERQHIATAFFPSLREKPPLHIIGRGTNPARTHSRIFAEGNYAYRCDTLADSGAEVALQCAFIPPPLRDMVAGEAEPLAAALLQWKQNVACFCEEGRFTPRSGDSAGCFPEGCIAGIHGWKRLQLSPGDDGGMVRTHDGSPRVLCGSEVLVTQMERGGASAKDLINAPSTMGTSTPPDPQAGTFTHAPEPPSRRVSMRGVLAQWLSALNALEVTHGLTYVDAHLGNFLLFNDQATTQYGTRTPTFKLVDLESLQPLYCVYRDGASTTAASTAPDIDPSTPAVPAAFARFLRAYDDSAALAALRLFFRNVLHHKMEQYMVVDLKALLETARCNRGTKLATADTDADFLAVEQFIMRVAEPVVRALGDGKIRPDLFFRTLHRAALDVPRTPREEALLSSATSPPVRRPPPTPLHCGDLAKLLIAALCLGFLACIAMHETGAVHWFSPSYLADGFCISNKDRHAALQSHAISFYADSILAIW